VDHSVQHTEADIDKHLAVFEEIAPHSPAHNRKRPRAVRRATDTRPVQETGLTTGHHTARRFPSAESASPATRSGPGDLILLFVVAIVNLNVVPRSHPTAASRCGCGSWHCCCFSAAGIAVIELAHRYPEEGACYLWQRESSAISGFLSGWCY